MIDEHFMRQWNDGHLRFTADVDRVVGRIGRFLDKQAGKNSIDEAYARGPSRTLFSGLTAIATTIALFVTVAALAAPPAASRGAAYVELASATEHQGSAVA